MCEWLPSKSYVREYYNRALRVHIEVLQAQDQSVEGLSDESENGLRKRTEKPDSEQFQSLITSQDFKNLFDQCETFKNSVRNGSLEKTAQFWAGNMDIIWLILCLLEQPIQSLQLFTLYANIFSNYVKSF